MRKETTFSKALGEGVREEMLRDEKVFLIGEDIALLGNTFKVYDGFLEEFGPDRVIDSPISEEGFTGMGVGAALRGARPVVELMYNDFFTCAADPILNQAAKMRYMTGGQLTVPMVIRMPFGAGRRNAAQHSQNFENMFCHVPGLKVVVPSNAEDAKGLIKTAIRDNDPVVFLEHKLLYAKKETIPGEEYLIPFGKAIVRREGTDITIITWSRQVSFALEAAEILAKEGINAEVLDLRTLVPLDWESIVASVSKTHRVIVASEEVKRGSYAGEISAQIAEELLDELDAPVQRLCALNIVPPFTPVLEDQNYPQIDDYVRAAKQSLGV